MTTRSGAPEEATAAEDSRDDEELARVIALEAGKLLLEVRADGGLSGKELGDEGDARSNALILERLRAARPSDAILSEESADDPSRLAASRVWIVDPLDGTREFTMPGRDDWAVHVALWTVGEGITAAAVAQPSLGAVYSGPAVGGTRPRDGGSGVAGAGEGPPVVLVSDSRPPSFAGAVAAAVGAELRPMGSAGAKAMAVLRGAAVAYVHAGGQWEWDSAAPVGVVVAHGLHASRIDGSPLLYNQPHPYLPDLVICRPELAERILGTLREHLA